LREAGVPAEKRLTPRNESGKKLEILLLSDHPLIPSGVGTQARYLIEGLLATGKFSFYCLGGAVKHPSYELLAVDEKRYGKDWLVQPVDGYGTKEMLRETIARRRPAAVVMFTDPRFFTWVWEMEDEVRSQCPLLYWHVWDNDPTPHFNRRYYDSTDKVVALSLKTYGLLQDLKIPKDKFSYIPHAVSPDVFRRLPEEDVARFKHEHLGPHGKSNFFVFWNNRNARRKMTGDVIASFSQFSRSAPGAVLMMHTNPADGEGQDIIALSRLFDVNKNLIISDRPVPTDTMNMLYNVADVTLNVASNEGFGLSTLESIMAGTPVIAHMTGGLQFQMGDWWKGLEGDFTSQEKMTRLAKKNFESGKGLWTGVPVFPAARNCVGSQSIPYIYDDRCATEDIVAALSKMHATGRERRRALGDAAARFARENFDLSSVIKSWDETLTDAVESFRSRPVMKFHVVSA